MAKATDRRVDAAWAASARLPYLGSCVGVGDDAAKRRRRWSRRRRARWAPGLHADVRAQNAVFRLCAFELLCLAASALSPFSIL